MNDIWRGHMPQELQIVRTVHGALHCVTDESHFFKLSTLSGGALGFGLDDQGFDSRRGLGIFFHHRVQTGSGAHPASYRMDTRGSLHAGEAAGA
jgi:hypothetical protein